MYSNLCGGHVYDRKICLFRTIRVRLFMLLARCPTTPPHVLARWLSTPHHPLESQPVTRFDWRLRSPSRKRNLDPIPSKRSKYIPRKFPDFIHVGQGEPFYDAIKGYQDRYVNPLLR